MTLKIYKLTIDVNGSTEHYVFPSYAECCNYLVALVDNDVSKVSIKVVEKVLKYA